MRTHFVYMALDADGIALYVGCTGNPPRRYRQHMAGDYNARGWFDHFVTRWHVSGPYTHDVALRIEKERIERYQPIFNGLSERNRQRPGERLLVEDYLRAHGVKFVPHHSVNRAVVVPIRGRRRLRSVA